MKKLINETMKQIEKIKNKNEQMKQIRNDKMTEINKCINGKNKK